MCELGVIIYYFIHLDTRPMSDFISLFYMCSIYCHMFTGQCIKHAHPLCNPLQSNIFHAFISNLKILISQTVNFCFFVWWIQRKLIFKASGEKSGLPGAKYKHSYRPVTVNFKHLYLLNQRSSDSES